MTRFLTNYSPNKQTERKKAHFGLIQGFFILKSERIQLCLERRSQRYLCVCSIGSTGRFAVAYVKHTQPAEYQPTNTRNDRTERAHWLYHRQGGNENSRNQTDLRCYDSHLELWWSRERRHRPHHHYIGQSWCRGLGPVSHQYEVSCRFYNNVTPHERKKWIFFGGREFGKHLIWSPDRLLADLLTAFHDVFFLI